jgi:hypothetical protein
LPVQLWAGSTSGQSSEPDRSIDRTPWLSLEAARDWLSKAASDKRGTMESKDLARMREQLERHVGLSLATIVEVSKRWPI